MINTEPCIAMKIGQKYLRERKNYKKLSKTYFTLQQKHYRVGHDANLPFTLKGIIFGDFSVRQVHFGIKESFFVDFKTISVDLFVVTSNQNHKINILFDIIKKFKYINKI